MATLQLNDDDLAALHELIQLTPVSRIVALIGKINAQIAAQEKKEPPPPPPDPPA